MKWCSTSYVIRKRHIKTMKYCYMSIQTSKFSNTDNTNIDKGRAAGTHVGWWECTATLKKCGSLPLIIGPHNHASWYLQNYLKTHKKPYT